MHPVALRRQAVELLGQGMSRREVCRQLNVGYNSTYRWQSRVEPVASAPYCFRCENTLPRAGYLYLLGQYLGDGHIAAVNRTTALRIYFCDAYPGVMDEVATAMRTVANVTVNRRQLKGCTQIQAATNHWHCLFPSTEPE